MITVGVKSEVNFMNVYIVIYGVGDACGGYNRAVVAAEKEEHLQALLNQEEGEDVLITRVQLDEENPSEYVGEEVISVQIA